MLSEIKRIKSGVGFRGEISKGGEVVELDGLDKINSRGSGVRISKVSEKFLEEFGECGSEWWDWEDDESILIASLLEKANS